MNHLFWIDKQGNSMIQERHGKYYILHRLFASRDFGYKEISNLSIQNLEEYVVSAKVENHKRLKEEHIQLGMLKNCNTLFFVTCETLS